MEVIMNFFMKHFNNTQSVENNNTVVLKHTLIMTSNICDIYKYK